MAAHRPAVVPPGFHLPHPDFGRTERSASAAESQRQRPASVTLQAVALAETKPKWPQLKITGNNSRMWNDSLVAFVVAILLGISSVLAGSVHFERLTSGPRPGRSVSLPKSSFYGKTEASMPLQNQTVPLWYGVAAARWTQALKCSLVALLPLVVSAETPAVAHRLRRLILLCWLAAMWASPENHWESQQCSYHHQCPWVQALVRTSLRKQSVPRTDVVPPRSCHMPPFLQAFPSLLRFFVLQLPRSRYQLLCKPICKGKQNWDEGTTNLFALSHRCQSDFEYVFQRKRNIGLNLPYLRSPLPPTNPNFRKLVSLKATSPTICKNTNTFTEKQKCHHRIIFPV